MKITKVMVNRKFNLSNYESLDLAAEAELAENDNPLEMWQIIRDSIEMEFIAMQRKTQPTTPEAPQQTQPQKQGNTPIDKIRMQFPEDVEARLTFEHKANYVIIKPKQFLGSELFSNISKDVRRLGGEYISAGKDSHWRVPV